MKGFPRPPHILRKYVNKVRNIMNEDASLADHKINEDVLEDSDDSVLFIIRVWMARTSVTNKACVLVERVTTVISAFKSVGKASGWITDDYVTTLVFKTLLQVTEQT